MYFTSCSVEEGSSESDTEAAEDTCADRKVKRNVSDNMEVVKIKSAVENMPVHLLVEDLKQNKASTKMRATVQTQNMMNIKVKVKILRPK